MYRVITLRHLGFRHRLTAHRARRVPLLPPSLAAVVGAAVLALGAPASAHTGLEQASPEPGSKISGGQQAVRLVFTEDIDLDLATVIVRAPNGHNLAEGTPSSVGGAILQPIGPLPVKGSYQVAYRVVSVDGHPIAGSYRFRVTRPAGPDGAPNAEAETAAPAAPAPTTPAAGQDTAEAPRAANTGESPAAASQDSATAPILGGALVLLVVAVGAFLAWRRRTTDSSPSAP